jgi:hypothetical protein
MNRRRHTGWMGWGTMSDWSSNWNPPVGPARLVSRRFELVMSGATGSPNGPEPQLVVEGEAEVAGVAEAELLDGPDYARPARANLYVRHIRSVGARDVETHVGQ